MSQAGAEEKLKSILSGCECSVLLSEMAKSL